MQVIAAAEQRKAHRVDLIGLHWAHRGEGVVRKLPEDAVDVDGSRQHQSVREKVQAQVGIDGRRWRVVGVDGEHHHVAGVAAHIVFGADLWKEVVPGAVGQLAQAHEGEPGVERDAFGGNGGEADAPCGGHDVGPFVTALRGAGWGTG